MLGGSDASVMTAYRRKVIVLFVRWFLICTIVGLLAAALMAPRAGYALLAIAWSVAAVGFVAHALAARREKSPERRISMLAGFVSLVGPASAYAVQSDAPRFFWRFLYQISLFLPLGILFIVGALGAGIGVFSVLRGAKVAGAICFLTNGAVLAYYGFLGVFSLLGGR